jgi:hypothetical protein
MAIKFHPKTRRADGAPVSKARLESAVLSSNHRGEGGWPVFLPGATSLRTSVTLAPGPGDGPN